MACSFHEYAQKHCEDQVLKINLRMMSNYSVDEIEETLTIGGYQIVGYTEIDGVIKEILEF